MTLYTTVTRVMSHGRSRVGGDDTSGSSYYNAIRTFDLTVFVNIIETTRRLDLACTNECRKASELASHPFENKLAADFDSSIRADRYGFNRNVLGAVPPSGHIIKPEYLDCE